MVGGGQTNKQKKKTYPLGGRNPQTIFICLEATCCTDLTDEVYILPVLRLLTLSALVLPTEVKEAAREHKEAAVVG